MKIHTDTAAAESAKSINASAYTHQNHIVFASNQYQPQSDGGNRLIAHELTHVIQQQNAPKIQRKDSYLKQEHISSSQIVGDEDKVKKDIIGAFSNPDSKLYKYVKDKLTKKFSLSIDQTSTFAYKYRKYAEARKIHIDPSIKDEVLVKDIAGFAEPKTSSIYLKTTSNYCDALHEYMHLMSNPDALSSLLGHNLMEGLTQYFSDILLVEQLGAICTTHEYKDQLKCAKNFVSALGGFDVAAELFFLNNGNILNKVYDILNSKDKHLLIHNPGDLHKLGDLCNYFK